MSNATNALEASILNHMFRTATWAKPSNIYIALLSAVADQEAGTVTEAAYPGYVRQQVTQADANWTAPAAGNQTFGNANTITFPANTGASPGDDETLTHYAIYDASSGGTALVVDELNASVDMEGGGEPADFSPGELTVQFTVGTDALALVIGNHLLRTDTWAKPSLLELGLYQTMPAQDGSGGVEVSGGSYARLNLGIADANWDAPDAANGTSNAVLHTFAQPTATWTINGHCLLHDGTIIERLTYGSTITRPAGSSACRFPIGRINYVLN